MQLWLGKYFLSVDWLAKSFFRALLTLCKGDVRLYNSKTHFSKMFISVSVISCGKSESLQKSVWKTSADCHISHAVLLPIPLNAETVSQPEKACKNSSPQDFSLILNAAAMSCAELNRNVFPWPKAIQILQSWSIAAVLMASTTTSV